MHVSTRLAAGLLMLAAAGCREGTAAPVPPAGPPAHFVVLYNWPKDTAAFEKYYSTSHLPTLAANAKAIGFTNGVLVKFTTTPDGKKPPYYRKAELTFASMDALKAGTSTPEFQKVAGDIPNFATGGFSASIGVETK